MGVPPPSAGEHPLISISLYISLELRPPDGNPDLSSLLSGLTGGGNGTGPPSGELDISKMMQLMSAVSGAGADDKNTALIAALKPYLSEQKQKKAEKAIKLLKVLAIFSALKEQGLLDDLSL